MSDKKIEEGRKVTCAICEIVDDPGTRTMTTAEFWLLTYVKGVCDAVAHCCIPPEGFCAEHKQELQSAVETYVNMMARVMKLSRESVEQLAKAVALRFGYEVDIQTPQIQ